MSFTVSVRSPAAEIAVDAGEAILDAALRQGVDYPHGCRSGNCGTCKSVLLAGEVEMSPYSEFALTEDEAAQGLILACRAVPWSDCVVVPVDAEDVQVHPQRLLDCRVAALDALTHDVRRLRLEIAGGGPFAFSAGQYASLEFPGLPRRDYSMANRPDEAILEFHIRLMPGGAVTPFLRAGLKVGDAVRVFGPFGTSYWRAKHAGPILAFAGGSGLAPVKSIVETALAAGARQPIRLWFGVRAERDVYFERELEALAARHPNFSYEIVLSEPGGATARPTGFLAELLARELGDVDGRKAYLAGPPVMVESCVAALVAKGLPRADCHADAFYTEAEKPRRAAGAARVGATP